MIDDFVAAYEQYCWAIDSIDDLKLAPFQVLAGEGRDSRSADHLGTSR